MNTEFTSRLISKRIWVPKRLHNNLQNNFYEFKIERGNDKINFLSRLSKDGRLVIPKSFPFENGEVRVTARKVRNSARPKIFLTKTRIDLLGLIPKKTLTDYEILAIPKLNKILLWYFASKGRPNEITINRYVYSDFCRLLGYYRAEGGKPRISYRRGREFSFTNSSMEIISDFVGLFGSLSDVNLLKASIRFSDKSQNKIAKIKNQLINLGLPPDCIRYGKGGKIRDFNVRLYITNSILSEFINNSESCMRKICSERKWKNFSIEYLNGVISGDGSLYVWRDKKGSNHARLQIFEPNKSALDDISCILESFGIRGRILNSDRKMYIYVASLNWTNCLLVYKNKLAGLKSNVLKPHIKGHKRFRPMSLFLLLPRKFTTSDFRKITKKSYGYSATWLKDREKEGLVKKIGKEDNKNVWLLKDSAYDLIKILKSLEA
ncbi:MAG: hypothetical protein HYT73_01475 [Candidatus Aenigmarchaeota archaeon]|nr:hypothetical protein [Candidatus Aenigmarchaeota archaeon]